MGKVMKYIGKLLVLYTVYHFLIVCSSILFLCLCVFCLLNEINFEIKRKVNLELHDIAKFYVVQM